MSSPRKRMRPVGGLEQPHDRARQRGLAAAGLAHQPERLALAQVEGHVVDGVDAADLAVDEDARP